MTRKTIAKLRKIARAAQKASNRSDSFDALPGIWNDFVEAFTPSTIVSLLDALDDAEASGKEKIASMVDDDMHDLHSCPDGCKDGICCLCEIGCRIRASMETPSQKTETNDYRRGLSKAAEVAFDVEAKYAPLMKDSECCKCDKSHAKADGAAEAVNAIQALLKKKKK